MSEVTEGIVTVLFTDVEGSTTLHSSRSDVEAGAILGACDELPRPAADEPKGGDSCVPPPYGSVY
jgi:class 3 adenylate cyclase